MATKDTGGGQQKATRSTEEVEQQAEEAQATDDLKERHEKLSDDVDSVLDEIDDVLEENAEDFCALLRSEGRPVGRSTLRFEGERGGVVAGESKMKCCVRCGEAKPRAVFASGRTNRVRSGASRPPSEWLWNASAVHVDHCQ